MNVVFYLFSKLFFDGSPGVTQIIQLLRTHQLHGGAALQNKHKQWVSTNPSTDTMEVEALGAADGFLDPLDTIHQRAYCIPAQGSAARIQYVALLSVSVLGRETYAQAAGKTEVPLHRWSHKTMTLSYHKDVIFVIKKRGWLLLLCELTFTALLIKSTVKICHAILKCQQKDYWWSMADQGQFQSCCNCFLALQGAEYGCNSVLVDTTVIQ